MNISQKSDHILEKYIRMKAKMSKSTKRDPFSKDGKISPGSDKSNSTLNIENLEDPIKEESKVKSCETKEKCEDEGPVNWPDDDRRWGNPPTVGRPTIVHAKFLIGQLQDLDTVRGTTYVRIGVWCNWKDHRLAGRSRMDPLPDTLWSPRLTVAESLGDFNRNTCELTLTIGTLDGQLYSLTWYEGTLKNPMDLHLFPLDTDTLHITFFASECYRRNGEINVNYKTDYRLLFEGWSFSPPKVSPYGWDLVSSKVLYVNHQHCQDVLQIQLNFKRCFNFYFFKVVFPLILITCLNFMGFSLDDDNLGERLANNISLFLSALALLYVVGQDLPKTTFLTAIDRIVIVTLSLIFATSVHFVYLHYKYMDENSEQVAPDENLFSDGNQNNVTMGNGKDNTTDTLNNKQSNNLIKHVHDHKVVLPYFFGFMVYIIFEFLVLHLRRFKVCKEFNRNLNKDRVFLDGVHDHNTEVKKDLTYKMPAYLMIDPFRLILVKVEDSRALVLPQLLTKVDVPVQLFLPTSGKAVVMSSRPAYKHDGKDVQWLTLGSPIRALEVIYDINLYIRVGY